MTDTENKIEQETHSIPPIKENTKSSKIALCSALLALFLILLLIAVAFFFYKENRILVATQQQQLTSLADKFVAQSSQQILQIRQTEQIKSTLEAQIEQTKIQLQQVNIDNQIVKTDIQSLQRSFSESNVRHPNDWILAEVEYLVALSARKIWLEQDINTAIALLVAADQRIVELNDASLSPLRGALLEDINALKALPHLDSDGIIIALTSLERRVDKLRSSSLLVPDIDESIDTDLSNDINEWERNLQKSWDLFITSFITVNKRDSKVEALLSPEKSWYLKENIRNSLAKAEFAIYRQQQDAYDLALVNILMLMKNYYDLKDNSTAFFYKSVQRLSQRNVSINYPSQLKSAPLLDRILELRLKKSFARSSLK
ncbi:MAG: uroporphyrinogen-III C-methyltransferase [Psychromonas sp.]